MKKRWLWVLCPLALLLLTAIVISCIPTKTSIIEDRIASLNPEEITACYIDWANPDGWFRFEITDPEKLSQVCEAVSHMQFREIEYERKMGGLYLIKFVQDNEEIYVFTYEQGGYVSISSDEYAAEVINIEEINDLYDWGALIRESRENAIKK